MSDILSQAEIDALLSGTDDIDDVLEEENLEFTHAEVDAIGEIGNISMGTAATTLFNLLGKKVIITTPKVEVTDWSEFTKLHNTSSYVAVNIEYTHGLKGTNMLILKERDAGIIAELMMGNDGLNVQEELTELHLSAVSEAMNQMIGSAATSMSSIFNKRIDISPPEAYKVNFDSSSPIGSFKTNQKLVIVAFKMVVGDLIDSEIMQLIPLDFAKELAHNLLVSSTSDLTSQKVYEPGDASKDFETAKQAEPVKVNEVRNEKASSFHEPKPKAEPKGEPVNVQYAQFESFDEGISAAEKANISLIMDVPLEITVELGRTQRLIRDILEFVPGSIVELDKLAGEPIDILVNGKVIAKGEVVVIDESFGVRITDIVSPSKRI